MNLLILKYFFLSLDLQNFFNIYVIHKQTDLLYRNSSMWLDTRDYIYI